MKQRLAGYLDQLSKSLITSVVTGVSELHANGRMKGSLINDVFFNLDRAVDLMDGINNMEPMLPNDNTLPSILHSHSARTLSDLQSFGDLKAVSRTVTTIYQAEQERQHGTAGCLICSPGASPQRRSCSLHHLCSTRTYSTLEVHLNVHTAAVSFSRRSASGATLSFHVHAEASGTGFDQCGIRPRSPRTVEA